MSKEVLKNPLIDYDNLLFYKNFHRIQPVDSVTQPVLKPFWVASVDPKKSPKVNALIKSDFQQTASYLKHLKRFRKITAQEQQQHLLQVLICPVEDKEFTQLQQLISDTLEISLAEVKLFHHDVPMNTPLDKETNVEWSNKYWPLVWKGNPLLQELNESFKSFDNEKTRYYLDIISMKAEEISKSNPERLPVVTAFVNPHTDEIMSISTDTRTENNPIKHSILNCIEEIADKELARRAIRQSSTNTKGTGSFDGDTGTNNNYLCLNYHVYTTHEPCTMCAMALLHSRISRLVFLKSSPMTGAVDKNSGCGYMIHLSCELNWKFESFEFCQTEDEFSVPKLDISVDV